MLQTVRPVSIFACCLAKIRQKRQSGHYYEHAAEAQHSCPTKWVSCLHWLWWKVEPCMPMPQFIQPGPHIFCPHDTSCLSGTFTSSVPPSSVAVAQKGPWSCGIYLRLFFLKLCNSLMLPEWHIWRVRNSSGCLTADQEQLVRPWLLFAPLSPHTAWGMTADRAVIQTGTELSHVAQKVRLEIKPYSVYLAKHQLGDLLPEPRSSSTEPLGRWLGNLMTQTSVLMIWDQKSATCTSLTTIFLGITWSCTQYFHMV